MAVDRATFARDFWDQAPLLTRAASLPETFLDLFSSVALDGLVADSALRTPFFKLVKAGSSLGPAVRSAVAGSRTIADLADAEAIARAFGDGATLILQSLHRMYPPVGALCRGLAQELGHPTQCNAYATPSGSARGFDFHHDTHDVVVLQIEGSKHWLVYPPVLELPTKTQPRSGPSLVDPAQRPILDIVLKPGDTLYLPRGYVHAAETTDEASLHLTIGIVVTTWFDVLHDAITTLAPEDLELRRALPLQESAGLRVEEAAADLLKRAVDWLSSVEPDQVADLLAARLRTAETIEPAHAMARAEAVASLTADSPVRLRHGVAATLRDERARVVLSSRVANLTLPAQAHRLLERAFAGPSTPANLVDGDPTCDLSDALVVVRRLLREGVLVADG